MKQPRGAQAGKTRELSLYFEKFKAGNDCGGRTRRGELYNGREMVRGNILGTLKSRRQIRSYQLDLAL